MVTTPFVYILSQDISFLIVSFKIYGDWKGEKHIWVYVSLQQPLPCFLVLIQVSILFLSSAQLSSPFPYAWLWEWIHNLLNCYPRVTPAKYFPVNLMQLATVLLQFHLLPHAIHVISQIISKPNYMQCHIRMELSSLANFCKEMMNVDWEKTISFWSCTMSHSSRVWKTQVNFGVDFLQSSCVKGKSWGLTYFSSYELIHPPCFLQIHGQDIWKIIHTHYRYLYYIFISLPYCIELFSDWKNSQTLSLDLFWATVKSTDKSYV